MKIGFRVDTLNLTDYDEAVYQYAKEFTISGNQALIFAPLNNPNHTDKGLKRMKTNFELHLYSSPKEFDQLDVLYSLESGATEYFNPKCRYLVHAYEDGTHPHGDKFAVVSSWMGRRDGCKSIVPFIPKKNEIHTNLRKQLGIPKSDIVVGRLGKWEWLKDHDIRLSLVDALSKNPNLWLLLENVHQFIDHPRVIYKSESYGSDRERFINTCDLGLDLSLEGDTFGMFNTMFAINNKPVILYSWAKVKGCLDVLRNCEVLYYHSPTELTDTLGQVCNQGIPFCNNTSALDFLTTKRVLLNFIGVFFK